MLFGIEVDHNSRYCNMLPVTKKATYNVRCTCINNAYMHHKGSLNFILIGRLVDKDITNIDTYTYTQQQDEELSLNISFVKLHACLTLLLKGMP